MSVDFSEIIDNFLTAELGEEVRGSLVEIAEALEAAINSQLNTVTSDLNDPDANTAAQAQAVGDILYGGSNHTGKTPSVNVHFSPTLEEGETFDVAEMPKNSHLYLNSTKLTNIPAPLQTGGTVYVARLPMTATGSVSMFFAHGVSVNRAFFCDFFSSSDTVISWREVTPTNRGREYGATNVDGVTNSGIYFSDLNGQGEKTLPDYPFRAGWLVVLTLPTLSGSPLIKQIAIPYQKDGKPTILQRSGNKTTGGTYDWGEWATTTAESDVEDFLYTDFEIDEDNHWWNSTGGRSPTGTVTKPIPVTAGQTLYGMWFGGNPPQACGGAFLRADLNWHSAIIFPYGGSSAGANVTEQTYEIPDVSGATSLTYAKLWKFVVPNDVAYVSLNLRREGSESYHCQCLGTMPIIGATGTGNRIWRKGDPQRAAKKDKTLYLIGPSTIAIDRSYRRIYDAPAYTDPTATYPAVDPYTLPNEPIVGLQEYLYPYYKEVISLGFDGQGYMSDGSTDGVVARIIAGDYNNATAHPLNDADEVVILTNGNSTGENNDIGEYDDDTLETYCGAVNNLIDHIYAQNSGHLVRIYLATRLVQYPDSDNRAVRYKERNAKFREIAANKGVALIEEDKAGINYLNYRFMSYDAERDIYNPYGGHPNNEGNRVRGQIILSGLLNNGT